MRKLRLLVLVGVMGFSIWVSSPKQAEAYVECDLISGTHCSPSGLRSYCIRDGMLEPLWCIEGTWLEP